MTNFGNLLAIEVWQWVVIVIVAVIVISVIMHFVNRSFRIKYDLNLFGGGFLMLVAIGSIVGGIFIIKGGAKSSFGYALFAVAAICVIITLIYDCKKCGAVGILAFFCQILFSVGSLLLLLEFKNNGYIKGSAETDRYVRRRRRELGYEDERGRKIRR